jgi:hypothetical protein
MKARRNKQRLTISLSPESVRYLKAARAERSAPSMSALFEKIVADLQDKSLLEEIDAKTQAYYDGLSDAEIKEQSSWGKLGVLGIAANALKPKPKPRSNKSRRRAAHRKR